MFCKNCGTQLPDGSVFCTECGARVQEEPVDQEPIQEEPVQPEPVQEPVQPEPIQEEPVQEEPVQPEPQYIPAEPQYAPAEPQCAPVEPQYTAAPQPANPDLNATPILITGILALALCETGIGGLICAIICLSKLKKFQAAGGVVAGKAKIGKILGTIGLIFSIIAIVSYCISAFIGIISGIGGLIDAAGNVSYYLN